MTRTIFIILILSILGFTSCHDEPAGPEPDTGKIIIRFNHLYGQEILVFDTLKYVNAAGNQLLFSEIQYFISDVTLHFHDGSKYIINAWKDIHYVDSDIPSTRTWEVFDSIPAGQCDLLSFTFGIDEEKNQSFIFVNPPESLMFWPDILGGGYHYMKLNGKWLAVAQQLNPFNFHLGIGQIYDGDGNITGFVQNYFTVALDVHSFNVVKNQTTVIQIIMHVDSWFDTPNIWDFDHWGGDIMQNQAAMAVGCENGRDVFSLELMVP